MTTGAIRIEVLADGEHPEVRELLTELALDEQLHYDHPQQSRAQIEAGITPVRRHFVGDNQVVVARGPQQRILGLCWCVLFDPGTGLEGEIAELYVRPEARGRGVARALAGEARRLFERAGVTFACVWTRPGNPAALKVYQGAGFRPTEQVVLTWLPLDSQDPRRGPT